MTNRQLATYNLILKNSLEGKVTTQEEIVSNYPKATYSDGYNYSGNPKVHDKCFRIWSDVTAINCDWGADKVIIIDNFTYHIGNVEETLAYRKTLKDKAMKALVKVSCITKKIKKNGQGIMADNAEQGELLTKRFVDSFVENLENSPCN